MSKTPLTPLRNPPQAAWEGVLAVRIGVQEGRIATVNIHSTRRLDAYRILIGKPIATVPRLMPLLYSVCGQAQKTAALLACEAACRMEVTPTVQRLRWVGLLAEVMREHLRYWTMGWHEVTGERDTPLPSDWQKGLALLKALQRLPDEADDAAIERALKALAILHHTVGATDEITERWHKAVLQRVSERHRLGDNTVPSLPTLNATTHAVWLQNMNRALLKEAHFAEKPHDQGQVYETGCLARMHTHPVVAEAIRESGRGLKARFLARQYELRELPKQMQRTLQQDGSFDAESAKWLNGLHLAPGIGISAVETARGRLIHRVEVDRTGCILAYQIVAPTEWNFHPDGALVKGLQGHRVPDSATAQRDTQDVIRALDPCVEYRVEIAS